MSKIAEELNRVAEEYGKEHTILPDYYNDGDIPDYEEWTAGAFKAGAIYSAKDTIARIRKEVERRMKESEKHIHDVIGGQFYGGIYGTCQNLLGFISAIEKEYE